MAHDIDPRLEATLWSMVNYDTMCNSPGTTEMILGLSMVEDTSVPESIDFEMGFGADDDYYSALASTTNGIADSEFSASSIGCLL